LQNRAFLEKEQKQEAEMALNKQQVELLLAENARLHSQIENGSSSGQSSRRDSLSSAAPSELDFSEFDSDLYALLNS